MKNLKLKAARAAMGLSQQALAELCGAAAYLLRSGGQLCLVYRAARLGRQICRVLGKTLDELFWEDDQGEPED